MSLADKLTASGGAESVGFLNDLVAQLWPNITAAGSKMTKDIVEPMFASMLPGTLATLHFVKIDLGPVPIKFDNVDVHKMPGDGIKLDLDLDWNGRCDIELNGKMMPKIGVEHIKLQGRLSVLLCPLINVIPLIGAAQVAFINPPYLKLDFTDAANIADCGLIDGAIRKVILNVISSMFVLPNRFLVKVDSSNDYFKTYQYQLGVLRLTVEKATGIKGPNVGGKTGFLKKLVKDVPDCYCKVNVAAEDEWKTSTQKNNQNPEWAETHDFLVTDHDQLVIVDVQDDDMAGDDDIGKGSVTVRQLLLNGKKAEIPLEHKDEPTDASVSISCQYFHLRPSKASFTDDAHAGEGRLCGLATILIGGAFGIPGKRGELQPSVKVSWGGKTFQTPAKSDAPGMDIENPSFDMSFRIPLSQEMALEAAPFKISLMNKKDEVGSVEVPFEDVASAENMTLENRFDMGNGATVRASISLRGIEHAES